MKEHGWEGDELASETAGTHYGAQILAQSMHLSGVSSAARASADITRAHSSQQPATVRDKDSYARGAIVVSSNIDNRSTAATPRGKL